MYNNIIYRMLWKSNFTNVKLCNAFCNLQFSNYSTLLTKNSQSLSYRFKNSTNFSIRHSIWIRQLSDQPTIKPIEEKVYPDSSIQSTNDKKLDESESLYKRFKDTYAVYGKLAVIIHSVSYCAIFSLCYLVVWSGLDVKALLISLHFPDFITNVLGKPGVGELVTAYLLCKSTMFFRYGFTIYLTRLIGRKYMPIKEENKLLNLAKQGKELSKKKLKDHLQEKMK